MAWSKSLLIDVAKAHVRMLTCEESPGKRYALAAQSLWTKDVSQVSWDVSCGENREFREHLCTPLVSDSVTPLRHPSKWLKPLITNVTHAIPSGTIKTLLAHITSSHLPQVLSEEFGSLGYAIPTKWGYDFIFKFLALFDSAIANYVLPT
ncbi:MAG: hypothetical protein GY737_10040, partial [Desulfobacteraceae bacterium]|nr:hypothetical protein [Desulfobacteraceae bacterium]